MNNLGVKYIAVLHDEAEPTDGFFSPPTMFDLKADADECWRDFTSGHVHHHRTLVVDLDSLPPAEATEVERAESQWLYHYARLQELRPDVHPEDAIAAELVRLRAACNAMRPIVEAALAVQDKTFAWNLPEGRKLEAAVVANRTRVVAALADVPPLCPQCGESPCNGDVHARGWRRGREDVSPETLTPSEWSVLFGLRKAIEDGRAGSYLQVGAASRRGDLISAIDKLRTRVADLDADLQLNGTYIRVLPHEQVASAIGMRLRVEREPYELTTVAEERTLPERVDRVDARMLEVEDGRELTGAQVRWLHETLGRVLAMIDSED